MSKTFLPDDNGKHIIDTEDCIIDGTKRTMRYKHVLGYSDKHESLEPRLRYNLISHRTGVITEFERMGVPPGTIPIAPTATDPLGHIVHVHYYECDELPGWIFEMLHDAWTQNNRRDRTVLEEVDAMKKRYIQETQWQKPNDPEDSFYDYLDPMGTKGEWEKSVHDSRKSIVERILTND